MHLVGTPKTRWVRLERGTENKDKGQRNGMMEVGQGKTWTTEMEKVDCRHKGKYRETKSKTGNTEEVNRQHEKRDGEKGARNGTRSMKKRETGKHRRTSWKNNNEEARGTTGENKEIGRKQEHFVNMWKPKKKIEKQTGHGEKRVKKGHKIGEHKQNSNTERENETTERGNSVKGREARERKKGNTGQRGNNGRKQRKTLGKQTMAKEGTQEILWGRQRMTWNGFEEKKRTGNNRKAKRKQGQH